MLGIFIEMAYRCIYEATGFLTCEPTIENYSQPPLRPPLFQPTLRPSIGPSIGPLGPSIGPLRPSTRPSFRLVQQPRNVRIYFTNFWDTPENMLHSQFGKWIVRAGEKYGLIIDLDPHNPQVVFLSCFGTYEIKKFPKAKKIFYTGENHSKRFDDWNSRVKGFDAIFGYVESIKASHAVPERQLEVPYWMFDFDFLDEKSSDYECLKTVPNISRVSRLASMVASSDLYGLRKNLLDAFREVSIDVDCPGATGKNVPDIERGWPAKRDFIAKSLFNLCPENSMGPSYTTEKLMGACLAGCIPVYWGYTGPLDRRIFNFSRILKFDNENPADVRRVASLCRNIVEHNDSASLYEMPAFLPTAEGAILEMREAILDFLGSFLSGLGR